MKRIILYLTTVFTLTYLYEYVCVVRFLAAHKEYTIAAIPVNLAVAMFIPAFSVLFVRLFTKEGLSGHYINFDLKNGKYKYYLLAWFLPAVLTLLGAALYFICYKGDFSKDMDFIIATYAKQGVTGITPDAMMKTAISQGITAILIGPVINCITTFGEEWGWRGYLLPKLSEKLTGLPLMLVMGVIWGLWHLPLTVCGHNYGTQYPGYPFLGIAAMVLFCFSIGTFLSYVTLKTGSCVPAIIGHGAINSFASIGIYFTKDGGRLLFGPAPTGVIAGIPCLVTAIILIRLMKKDDEKEK
ncbi:MAG: CPBP family intramembrane metalloprotease [Lachnospiraceae bacterium]|nr:CPBP family intramembrane metalloprotease [Lachnospiraceae bacterium]